MPWNTAFSICQHFFRLHFEWLISLDFSRFLWCPSVAMNNNWYTSLNILWFIDFDRFEFWFYRFIDSLFDDQFWSICHALLSKLKTLKDDTLFISSYPFLSISIQSPTHQHVWIWMGAHSHRGRRWIQDSVWGPVLSRAQFLVTFCSTLIFRAKNDSE